MRTVSTFLLLLFCFTSSFANNDIKTSGTITGSVMDRESEEPIAFAYLHVEELKRTITTHADGTFELKNIPSGTYTISVQRIGYQTVSRTVEIADNETTSITITLKATVLSSEAVEVVGQSERGQSSRLEHASKSISGTELRQDLGATLANTLSNVPGLSSRSMGTAPGRPIMRGLGGERLLILQDGERTGDVSSQSADHAVTVDPMSAEEIEIARGPAALQYGSNAIGGVINVVRNQVTASQPDHLHGTGSLQGESVNNGAVGGVELSAPIGENFAVKMDGNLRTSQNMGTPQGELQNSGILSTNNALGFSYIKPWGHAGIASSIYLNNYGIPPDPAGGHENGVDIEMQKVQVEAKSEIFLKNSVFNAIDAKLSYKNYYHREIEPGGAIGTEFGVLTGNTSLRARHGKLSVLDEGIIGIWGETKDYAVRGTRTPDSKTYSFGTYLVEEKDIGPLHLEIGSRFDHVTTIPEEEDPNSSIGFIRERTFNALATSASAILDMGKGFHLGTTFMHSFRAPSQEELYSEGPHLASYSYEVGNPDLDPERALGKELFLRFNSTSATAEVSVYHNSFSNYIYARDTGEPSIPFPSLNLYQFTGTEALLRGFEASAEIQLLNNIAFNGSLSYTHARRKANVPELEWQPLPLIPPLKGNVGITYSSGGFRIGSKAKIAAEQTRTGDFETPTDGYTAFDVFSQYRFEGGGMLHTVSLNMENVFNTTYRDHLSRIKDLMPEPGRNISLLYRVYF